MAQIEETKAARDAAQVAGTLDNCRSYAASMRLKVTRDRDSRLFQWSHSAIVDNDREYVSELDCIWEGLSAIAKDLAMEGFPGSSRDITERTELVRPVPWDALAQVLKFAQTVPPPNSDIESALESILAWHRAEAEDVPF